MTTPTADLSAAGVSIWLDDLSRERLNSGGFKRLIEDLDVVGVTTNPSIFAAALKNGDSYATQVGALAEAGADVDQAVFDITTHDVAQACDLFAAEAKRTDGADGRVSIEVDPRLSRDTAGTIAEAKRLHAKVQRTNVLIKIPATVEGLEAITATLAAGISVNVTLIFSLDRYRAVINAYMLGIEQARENGHDLSKIQSVASFFVSRVDAEIDKRLDAIGSDEATALKGKAGVANARLAYRIFEEQFATERWQVLKDAGANAQRPLWASTGVKDPNLPDTLYVAGLVAPDVVNTMPEKTLDAMADHGVVEGDTITATYDASNEVLDTLDTLGVSYSEVVDQLETEGLDKFVTSWSELLETVQTALDAAKA
ncbi:transaldolase [Arthrobacter sp. RIT-PI-e]|uniref:transaldolase n=1 Tax=Arthrobacter sp. RIT-PI-e TaxID=1681197 RepID=UPI000675DCF4|nr:transaldolase [Arthrobacter sp. RIT-PI-e]KNC20423.1 transaldolase [Arthrobacter sp. RIT-PI-e]